MVFFLDFPLVPGTVFLEDSDENTVRIDFSYIKDIILNIGNEMMNVLNILVDINYLED